MGILNPADFEVATRQLISARALPIGIEVTVPVAYAGGDIVSVVVEQAGDLLAVHDAGIAAMRLSSAGITLSKALSSRLAELAARFNCDFKAGRVSTSAHVSDDVAVAICLVANASRSVADYELEVRRLIETDFRFVVNETLRKVVGDRLRENQEFKGKSGRRYRVPGMLLNSSGSAPAHFIAALAHRQSVDRSFTMLHDLHLAYPDVENEAVYDDAGDFRHEDRELLNEVSTAMTLLEVPMRFRTIVGHG